MKIRYVESVYCNIKEIVHTAKLENKEIDYIELTIHEYSQLLEEIGPLGTICHRDPFTNKRSILGTTLKVLS